MVKKRIQRKWEVRLLWFFVCFHVRIISHASANASVLISGSFPASSRFGLLPDQTRAQRARENDAESTERWRVIDSGANERSRFCVLAVVFETRVLLALWLFCPFVPRRKPFAVLGSHKKHIDRTKNKM